MATAKWKPVSNFEDLKRFPQIMNTAPHASASGKYKLVHTLDILEAADRFGWKPAYAAGTDDNPFGFHAIKLENPEYVLSTGDKVQMILNNSHDRTRRFSMDAGIFRLVCSNGLVIPIVEFASIKRKHMGFDSMELLEEILLTIENIDLVAPKVKIMSEIDLTIDQREDIAIQALISRLGEEELAHSVDLDAFLTPKRATDKSTDLWTTFNIVQEKIQYGDFQYETVNGKGVGVVRKGRAIDGFKKDLKLNKQLFRIVNEYIPA